MVDETISTLCSGSQWRWPDLLAEHLPAHLEYEEESISPTLRTWRHWPVF